MALKVGVFHVNSNFILSITRTRIRTTRKPRPNSKRSTTRTRCCRARRSGRSTTHMVLLVYKCLTGWIFDWLALQSIIFCSIGEDNLPAFMLAHNTWFKVLLGCCAIFTGCFCCCCCCCCCNCCCGKFKPKGPPEDEDPTQFDPASFWILEIISKISRPPSPRPPQLNRLRQCREQPSPSSPNPCPVRAPNRRPRTIDPPL